MSIMTHAKFHLNWLMLILIFGIWASEPPSPALQTTEMAGFDGPHPISSRGHLAHPQGKILVTIELVQVSSSYFVTFPKI